MAHRIGIALATALLAAGLGSAGSAAAGPGAERMSGSEAAAAVRGLDLNVFGSPLALASTSAAINLVPEARAGAVGASSHEGDVTAARADSDNKRDAFESCVPELSLVKLLDVRRACSESRAQLLPELFTPDFPRHLGASLTDPATAKEAARPSVVDNGGPQAVARGSVAGAGISDVGLLQPADLQLRSLLDSLNRVADQTVAASTASIDPSFAPMLEPLAATMGLRPGHSVRPVVTLLTQLVDGSTRATGLATMKLAGSTATTNINAQEVVALAQAGDGQIDLLPGLAPGGGPLLSVVFGGVRAISRFDRSTGGRSSAFERPETTIRLGLPLAGDGVTELKVRPDAPVTVLAGTPLETTISAGVGGEVAAAGGSVSFVDGAGLQMLKGVKGGIDLRLGHAKSSTGDPPPIPESTDADRWLGGLVDAHDRAQGAPRGSVRNLLLLGLALVLGDLALLASISRRRRRVAQAWPAGRRW